MKRYFETFAILTALVCTFSCSKESAGLTGKESERQPEASAGIPLTFMVGINKTILVPSTGAVNFNQEDKISVFDGGANNIAFENTTEGDNKPSANFYGKVKEEADTYYALYPYQEDAKLEGTEITGVSLPATQNAEMNSFDPAANISVGCTSSENLYLRNVCSLLKIVVNPGESYSKAVITSNDGTPVCGTLSISNIDNAPTFSLKDGTGSSSVTLLGNMGSTVDPTAYYVVILPNTYKGFTVRLYKEGQEGAAAMKYINSGVTIARSEVGSFGHIESGLLLPGVFTVNSEGKQVQFARGNVWKDTEEGSCYFEEEQYYFHSMAKQGSTAFYSYYNGQKIQETTKTTTAGFFSASDFKEDFNSTYNEWELLSMSEWEHLCFNRSTDCLNDDSLDNSRYAIVVITDGTNKINGHLYFPDKFSWPDNVVKPGFINPAKGSSGGDYSTITRTIYTIADFKKIEKCGCIFLPAVGRRSGTTLQTVLFQNGATGPWQKDSARYYMTDIDNNKNYFKFTCGSAILTTDGGSYGYQIRLAFPALPNN